MSMSRQDAKRTTHAPWHGRRVVLVQDEALTADPLKQTLLDLGYIVMDSARNGVEALALTRQWQADVVVMDLRTPGVDDWTAMAELGHQGLAALVVVWAPSDHNVPKRAVRAGAGAILMKPIREGEIDRALELAAARLAQVQELRQQQAEAEQQRRELDALRQALQTTQTHLGAAAQRAATVGLAQGLTHEINNALTPIIGNGQILALLHAQDPEIVERAGQIVEHAKRIADWTASFRQLAIETHREPIEFSLNGLVGDVLALYAKRLERKGISQDMELDAALPVLRGHPNRLQQVLILILQNAIEAMPQGGTLEIRTVYNEAQQTVDVTLSDTGMGIATEHAARLFEPGFTTKDQATHALAGWGLFTARQIVQAHAGSIQVSSPTAVTGRGTQVRLRLPLQIGLGT